MHELMIGLRAQLLHAALARGLGPVEALAEAKSIYAWVAQEPELRAPLALPAPDVPARGKRSKARRRGGRRPAKPKAARRSARPAADAGARDAAVKEMWLAGDPVPKIARKLKVSEPTIYSAAKRLDLPKRDRAGKPVEPAPSKPAAPAPRPAPVQPAPRPAAPAAVVPPAGGEALTEKEILRFLSQSGFVVYGPDDDGHYSVEKRKGLDGAGLLQFANDYRARFKLAPFKLREG